MKTPDLLTSILRFINGRNDNAAYLQGIYEYITDPAKTDGGSLVTTQGCSSENPLADILMNKKLHHQTHGKQGVHFVLSCPPNGDARSPADLLRVTQEIVRTVYPDYLAVIAVHTDSKAVHSHVVMDAVNAVTGKKFSQGAGDLNRVKQKANDSLVAHGFEIIRMSANDFVDRTDHSRDEGFDYLELDESVLITEQDMKMVSPDICTGIYMNYQVTGGSAWSVSHQTYHEGGYSLMKTHSYPLHAAPQPVEETRQPLTEQTLPAEPAVPTNSYPNTTVVTGPTFRIQGTPHTDFSGLGEIVTNSVIYAEEHQRDAANLALAMQKKTQDGGFPSNVAVIAGPVFDINLTTTLRSYGSMIGDDGEEID